jgi:hypothetical protein
MTPNKNAARLLQRDGALYYYEGAEFFNGPILGHSSTKKQPIEQSAARGALLCGPMVPAPHIKAIRTRDNRRLRPTPGYKTSYWKLGRLSQRTGVEAIWTKWLFLFNRLSGFKTMSLGSDLYRVSKRSK